MAGNLTWILMIFIVSLFPYNTLVVERHSTMVCFQNVFDVVENHKYALMLVVIFYCLILHGGTLCQPSNQYLVAAPATWQQKPTLSHTLHT